MRTPGPIGVRCPRRLGCSMTNANHPRPGPPDIAGLHTPHGIAVSSAKRPLFGMPGGRSLREPLAGAYRSRPWPHALARVVAADEMTWWQDLRGKMEA
jgi:hypothetical protein